MEVYDHLSHLFIADPERDPFPEGLPNRKELQSAMETFILSASGWRTIFSADSDPQSRSSEIDGAHKIMAAAAAFVLTEHLKALSGTSSPVIYTGCDARPTGSSIMDIMHRVFLGEKTRIHPIFICAAPEIMASVKLDDQADGFAYISASHNPIGYNGFKFGGADGAVYGGSDSAKLIHRFRELIAEPDIIERMAKLIRRTNTADYSELLQKVRSNKHLALQRYTLFTQRVVSGKVQVPHQQTFFQRLEQSLSRAPVGIIGELNGSARSTSIDLNFLRKCGFMVEMFNNIPGQVVHRIVPEGESLNDCLTLLEKLHGENGAYTLGYVPDNDGDRGNIVFFNKNRNRAEIIQAQEVFALAVLAELAYDAAERRKAGFSSSHESAGDEKQAVVVNGPTSMRIEEIARIFSAEVYRAEVGEANVVNLAEHLRSRGYRVRILGEGSNGGNITHPATVRDPLNTLFSLIKLLSFREEDSPYNLFKQWCSLAEGRYHYDPEFNLQDILGSLPAFITTSAYEDEAIMKIKTIDHGLLKRRYEEIFLEEWEKQKLYLRETFGIHSWREINYEGTEMKAGFGPDFRSGEEKGGLKIIFTGKNGQDSDFIWMRGSGTEPVFRVMVDCAGTDRGRHDWLLHWQRDMIERADSAGSKKRI